METQTSQLRVEVWVSNPLALEHEEPSTLQKVRREESPKCRALLCRQCDCTWGVPLALGCDVLGYESSHLGNLLGRESWSWHSAIVYDPTELGITVITAIARFPLSANTACAGKSPESSSGSTKAVQIFLIERKRVESKRTVETASPTSVPRWIVSDIAILRQLETSDSLEALRMRVHDTEDQSLVVPNTAWAVSN